MSEIENIRAKYLKDAPVEPTRKEPLKQNLQADVSKVEAITRKISEKQAASSELARLRTAVARLLSVIDHNDHPLL